jgi:hypothetical protein
MGCGRQYCPACGEELIHRDHRKIFESASALGQIIRRLGPKAMGAADLDLCTEKCIKPRHLLRLLEHKQDNARAVQDSQAHILWLLAWIIDHAVHCDADPKLKQLLDPRCGVFVIRGTICGSDHGRREIRFTGPQTITKLINGESFICNAHDNMNVFNDWIYGSKHWREKAG